MKKLFLLALSTAFFISCANDDRVTTTVTEEVASTEDLAKYADVFRDYENFTVDGENTEDKVKIINLLQNAAVTNYEPELKTVHLFSSLDKFEEVTKFDIDKFREPVPLQQDPTLTPNSYIEDSENYKLDGPMPVEKATLLDTSGLNSIAGNTTYTNIANQVHMTIKYSNRNYIAPINDNNDTFYWQNAARSYKNTSSSASTVSLSIGHVTRDLQRGNSNIWVQNDNNYGKRLILFFSGKNYGGGFITLTLSKNSYTQLSRYYFDSLSSDYPKSIRVFEETDFYCWYWGC